MSLSSEFKLELQATEITSIELIKLRFETNALLPLLQLLDNHPSFSNT